MADSTDDKDRRPLDRMPLDEALKRGEDTASEIDPALVARLEAWFGPAGPSDPAADEDELEQMPGLPPGWFVPKESEEEIWRRARALETAATGELLTELEHRAAARSELVEPLPELELSLERPLNRFDMPRWGIRGAAQHVDRPRPEDLWDSLREQVPQALLRDLHRPVPEVGPVELERTTIDFKGEQEAALVKALIRARYKVEIERLTTARHQIAETMSDLRARLDQEPWQDSRPETPAPWPSAMPEADLARWFMPDGGK